MFQDSRGMLAAGKGSVNESDASRVVCKYGSVSDTLRSMQPLPEYMDVNLAIPRDASS